MLGGGRRYIVLLWLCLVVLFTAGQGGFVANAASASLPALGGRVVDNASIIDNQTRLRITSKLEALENKTGDQLVVATIPSLNGEDIESFANRLFRSWALGQKKINNGILLVVAPNDRQVRIEVGYGMEGVLTDALSAVIINTFILPAFRDGEYSKGIADGVDNILSVVSGDKAGVEQRIQQKKAADAAQKNHDERIDLFMQIVFFSIMGFVFFLPMIVRTFGTEIKPNRYRWMGVVFNFNSSGHDSSGGGFGGGGFGGGSSGGFGGGGGSSGGGGASGRW